MNTTTSSNATNTSQRGPTRIWILVVFALVAVVIFGLWGLGDWRGLIVGGPTSGTTAQSIYRAKVSPVPQLNQPGALAVDPKGGVLISNVGTNQLLLRSSNGRISVVAGTGKPGYFGDGGPAREAELNAPGGIAVSSNGTIYLADSANNRVRAISTSGVITTVAGNGHINGKLSGGLAVNDSIVDPTSLALGPNGQLYVVDEMGLQMISSSDILTTVIGAKPSLLKITTINNGAGIAFNPTTVAVDPAGDIYVFDFSPKLLIEFSKSGTILGSWQIYVAEQGLAVASNNSLIVADYGNFSIDRAVAGKLTYITRFKLGGIPGLAGIFRPTGVAASASGEIYVDTDGENGGINHPALIELNGAGTIKKLVA